MPNPEPTEPGTVVAAPKIRPTVVKVNSIAKRVVSVGKYQSFEISTMLECEPDPAFSARANVEIVQKVVTETVNTLADRIEREFTAANNEADRRQPA